MHALSLFFAWVMFCMWSGVAVHNLLSGCVLPAVIAIVLAAWAGALFTSGG